MNNLKVFSNEEFGAVRVTTIDGEPWFVGKDVAEVLGYANPSKALADHVDEEDKLNNETLSSFEFNLGQRGGWLINESGLYSLVLKSKLNSAKKFKRWVTKEVLPAIRKTGGYVADDDLFVNTYFGDLDDSQQLVIKTTLHQLRVKDEKIKELAPKADYHDKVLTSTDTHNVTSIAKEFGLSAVKLNKILHEQRVQFKQDGHWVLYARYADKGYVDTVTNAFEKSNGEVGTKLQTKWTERGRKFIHELLESLGYVRVEVEE